MIRRDRIRSIGLLVGLAGLAVAVASTASDLDRSVLPDPAHLGFAAVLSLFSLLAAGRSWTTLLEAPPETRSEVAGALYISQLSKYLPAGGLLQAAGQVTLTGASIPLARVAVAYPVAALEVVVCGAALGAGLATAADLPLWARVAAGLAPASLLALHPRLLRGVLAIARRVSSRVPDSSMVPVGRTVARSAAWAGVNMTATSISFTLLLRGAGGDGSLLVMFSAFAAAWVIGFLVVPVPSGLGIREAVLVMAIPGLQPGAVLAASLAHRIVTLLAEILVVGFHQLARRLAHRNQ